jgi:hypothetical protein
MADESYWEYKAAPTPSLIDAKWIGAIRVDTTEADWYKLSPGMRREIVRAKVKNANPKL